MSPASMPARVPASTEPAGPPATELAPGRDGEREFIRLANAAPAMIWMSDAEGRWTFANENWLQLRGRTLHQEAGWGWCDGIHPDHRRECLKEYRRFLSTRSSFRIRYRASGQDGVYRTIDNIGSPWFESGDELQGYVGYLAVASDSAKTLTTEEQLFSLTRREREMLQLIALGLSSKEAAAKLGISYKTADSHRTHILKKLGVHETAGLVRFAFRSGLIEV
jgi:PAS domain S-box-containing protein